MNFEYLKRIFATLSIYLLIGVIIIGIFFLLDYFGGEKSIMIGISLLLFLSAALYGFPKKSTIDKFLSWTRKSFFWANVFAGAYVGWHQLGLNKRYIRILLSFMWIFLGVTLLLYAFK